MTYYLYHIPGKKIGVTCDLNNRVTVQQGYTPDEYEILDAVNEEGYGVLDLAIGGKDNELSIVDRNYSDLAKGTKEGFWQRIGKKGSKGVKYQRL